jgi:hypothetical protein
MLLHLPSLQTSFIHDTSHVICQFSLCLLFSRNPCFFQVGIYQSCKHHKTKFKKFLTNIKKQIGSNSEGEKKTLKEKKRGGGTKVLLLPKLGDGAHLCPKTTKQKKKRKELKLPIC